jgi:hypothetical protein
MAGAEDNTHVNPYWHRFITQLAWFKLRLFNCCDGGFIEGFTMGVQKLNVCRDAVGVNYHGQYGHALNYFRGYARRVWNINGTQQPGRCDLGARVVHAILIRKLVQRKTHRYCILRSGSDSCERQ